MSNNKGFQADIDIEHSIKEMPDRQLLEFTARQVYSVCGTVRDHGRRINNLEGRARKTTGIAGGIGTAIGAAIVTLFNYFAHR